MKKLIVFLSLFVTLICIGINANATTIAGGDCGTNVYWTLDDMGTVRIAVKDMMDYDGTGTMNNYSYLNGRTSPWYRSADVKKVVIEDGILNVGNYAFYG